MCNLVEPSFNCGSITLQAAFCDGRKVPEKWILPKSGNCSGMAMLDVCSL